MKFIHIADIHFDTPFTTLNKKELGNTRRLEQRRIFKKMIEYAKQNEISSIFICGDLYEQEYVKQSTITYINALFAEIPDTNIYIVPGNHDPRIKNSYYSQFNWSPNVSIFQEKVEVISTQEADIYGFGFQDFYQNGADLTSIQLKNPDKINILLTHGTLDASCEEDKQYNPMSKRELKKLGFDYIALGHIHKPSSIEERQQAIAYAGSMMSLGFDELGQHGMLVGEISEQKKLSLEFIQLDETEFVEKKVFVDEIYSKEELIENLDQLELEQNKYYKIILEGKRNFEILIYEIEPHISNSSILKIKDQTSRKLELEKIATQHSLKGIFVKNMLQKLEAQQQDNQLLKKAIEIGLDAM